MRKYRKDKMMMTIRYLLIFTLVTSYISFYSESDTLNLMLLLVFIIINQLRFFTFERKPLILGTIFSDMVLIYVLYNFQMPFFSIFFLLSAIDIVLAFDFKVMVALNSLLFAQMGVMYHSQSFIYLVTNAIFFLICTLMVYQLKIQYEKKAEAQSFYDQLRVKEEELVALNHKLEKYANTVESLTLLRERNRITREIHDHVGHRLSAAIIQLSAIEKVALKDVNQAVAMVSHLRDYQQESLQNIRELINELKPKEFDRYEDLLVIEQMVKNFEKLTNVEVKMSILNDEEMTWALSEKQGFTLYRIIQEFLSNSLRHGKATEVDVSFNFQEHSLVLMIRDNGVGNAEVIEGNGITNMRQRIKELGGQLKYKTDLNEGFFTVMTVPKEGGIRDGY